MKLYKEEIKQKPNYRAIIKRGIAGVALVMILSAAVVGGVYGYHKLNTKHNSATLIVERW